MSSLPNAALSAGAVTEPRRPSPALAATLTCAPPWGVWGCEGLERPQKPVGDLSRPSHLQRDFCPSGVGQVLLHIQRVGDARGDGGFWLILLVPGAPASPGGRLPPLALGHRSPGGGLGLSPLSRQRWPEGWDDAPCGVTRAVGWSRQLRPCSPEIHGCWHVAAALLCFRKRSRRGAAGAWEESGVGLMRGCEPPNPPPAPAGSSCPRRGAGMRPAGSPASRGDGSAGSEQLFEPIPVSLGPPERVSKHSGSLLAYFSAHCPAQ